jgi:uncharacterized protein
MVDDWIEVTVCIAWPERQCILPVRVPRACNVAQALTRVELQLSQFDRDWAHYSTAIFGKSCSPAQVLLGGEQIELLRPLRADPNLARQRRVEVRRKAMGRTAWRRNSRSQKVQSASD